MAFVFGRGELQRRCLCSSLCPSRLGAQCWGRSVTSLGHSSVLPEPCPHSFENLNVTSPSPPKVGQGCSNCCPIYPCSKGVGSLFSTLPPSFSVLFPTVCPGDARFSFGGRRHTPRECWSRSREGATSTAEKSDEEKGAKGRTQPAAAPAPALSSCPCCCPPCP